MTVNGWKGLSVIAMTMLISASVVGCQVEQTREGELPDVDVDVQAEPGQLPAYEVEGPEVEVGTTEETIEVPEVEVTTEETTVDVPTVDVDLPGDEEDSEAAE